MKKSTVVWLYVIIVNFILSYMLQIKVMPMNFWIYMLCSGISYAIGVIVINIIFGQIEKRREELKEKREELS